MTKADGAVSPRGLAAPLICGKISISGGTADGGCPIVRNP